MRRSTTTFTTSLLDKITHFIQSGLAIVLIPFFFACDDPADLGLEVDKDQVPVNVNALTIDLPISTVYIDSLRTDRPGSTLFGKYAPNAIDSITATSFLRINQGNGVLPDTSSSLVDAEMWVVIGESRIVSGNNDLSIHRVNDTVFSNAVYNARDKLEYSNDPVASTSFFYEPDSDIGNSSDTVVVKLDQGFGEELFGLIFSPVKSRNSEKQDSLTKGQYILPSLAIVPGSDNQDLLRFQFGTSGSAGIYLNMKGTEKNADSLFTYKFGFNQNMFSSVERRYNGADVINAYADYDTVPNLPFAYHDQIAGTYPQIDLTPYLDALNGLNEEEKVNHARLEITYEPSIENNDFTSVNALFKTSEGRIDGGAVQIGQYVLNVLMPNAAYGSGNRTPLNMALRDGGVTADITLFSSNLLLPYINDNEGESFVEQIVLTHAIPTSLSATAFAKTAKIKLYYTSIK